MPSRQPAASDLLSRRRSPHGVIDLGDLDHNAALGRQLVVDAVHPGPHGIEVRPLLGYLDIPLDLEGLRADGREGSLRSEGWAMVDLREVI